MKKLIASISCVIISLVCVYAQHLPQVNQYAQNAFLINPAFAGIEDFTDFKTGFRQQWAGFEGAPMTAYLTVHGSIRPKEKSRKPYGIQISDTNLLAGLYANLKPTVRHGIGGTLIYDRIAGFDRIMAAVNYSFHFPIGRKVMIALSPSIGISNTGYDPSKISMIDPNDPTFTQFIGNGSRITTLDIGIGGLVYGKKWHLGYSVAQVLQNKIYFGNTPTNYRFNMHHFLAGGYTFQVKKWELSPGFLVKMALPNPVSFDVTFRFRYNKIFWTGASYRFNNSVVALLGFNIKNVFSIGYSFDYPYNMLRANNFGSHEVVLGFSPFNKKKTPHQYLW